MNSEFSNVTNYQSFSLFEIIGDRVNIHNFRVNSIYSTTAYGGTILLN